MDIEKGIEPIPTPEQLFGDYVEIFGVTETARNLRLQQKNTAQVISKMKSPPDERNEDNGNHTINFFERAMFSGDSVVLKRLVAQRDGDTATIKKLDRWTLNVARFLGRSFGFVPIPVEEYKAFKEMILRCGHHAGIMVVTLGFIVGAFY